jgi:hypothetical protein
MHRDVPDDAAARVGVVEDTVRRFELEVEQSDDLIVLDGDEFDRRAVVVLLFLQDVVVEGAVEEAEDPQRSQPCSSASV